MKKLIISLFIVATLLSPFSVKAVESTNSEMMAQITAQIEALQVQLQIQLLLQKIADLQAQIAVLLANQTSQTAVIQAQGAVLEQVVVNTTPTGGAVVAPCVSNWQCSEWNTCTDYSQIRSCSDINNCNVLTDKPTLKQSCVSVGTLSGSLENGKIKLGTINNSYIINYIEITIDPSKLPSWANERIGIKGFFGGSTSVIHNSGKAGFAINFNVPTNINYYYIEEMSGTPITKAVINAHEASSGKSVIITIQ